MRPIPPLGDITPSLPHQGPPLPKGWGVSWPVTADQVENAVENYRRSMERATERYKQSLIVAFLLVRNR